MNTVRHIPLELLQTFVAIVQHEGDASAAAQSLGITQPSISKRMTSLRRIVSDDDKRSWLILKGKRWQTTAEGDRVRGVVTDLVRRYDQVEQFVANKRKDTPQLAIACGQTAASGFVGQAIEQLMTDRPEIRVTMSKMRGRWRIEGVAGGQFDLAIVTDGPATIRDVAGMDLFIEPLELDRMVMVANPRPKADWAKAWHDLPIRRPLKASDLVDLPLILPESDSSRRQQFDTRYGATVGRTPSVLLEVGGWQSILQFANSGLGVGMVTEQSAQAASVNLAKRNIPISKSMYRILDEQDFPPDAIRLIARKRHGRDEPELTAAAQQLYSLLKQSPLTTEK